MKNYRIIPIIFLAVFCLSCNKESDTEIRHAQVETLEAKEVSDISAVCRGRIIDSGDGAISEYGMEVKKDGSYKKYPHTYSSENEFGVTLTGLAPEWTYQYRAYIDDGNIQYGSEKSFTTFAAFEYSAIIDQESITTHSAVILFTFTDRLREWGVFYCEGKPTVNDAVKKEFAKAALSLDDLKSGTQYNLLPYVKDKQDIISYLPEITFTTAKEKGVCMINGRSYVVDTLQNKRQVGDGTFYYSVSLAEYPLKVYVLEVNFSDPAVRIETCLANDSAVATERPTKMVERKKKEGYNVIGAINGDFYFYQDPVEIGIPRSGQFHQNEMMTNPTGRACFVLGGDGKPYIDRVDFKGTLKKGSESISIHTVNMLRLESNDALTPNLMTLYTPAFGNTTSTISGGTKVVVRPKDGTDFFFTANKDFKCIVEDIYDNPGRSRIPKGYAVLHGRGTSSDFLKQLSVNDEVTISLKTDLRSSPGLLLDFKEMVGGSDHIILKNGERAEGDNLFNPRTGMGYSKDKKKVYMIVVDGRQTDSKGCTMKDFGDIFRSTGAWNAVNLDGGGSSVMIVGDEVMNNPSDGSVRAIGNGVLVISK